MGLLRVLLTTALCICFVQICLSNEFAEKRIDEIKEDFQNKTRGLGAQFVEDVTAILDHKPSNPYFVEVFYHRLVSSIDDISSKQNHTKFYVQHFSDNHPKNTDDYHTSIKKLDDYKILQSILSKHFPSERYNGVINMFYVSAYPNATTEEISNVVNYLDGTDNAATRVSYLESHDIPEPEYCPVVTLMNSEAEKRLNKIRDIKSKVFEDFASIREKFRCNVMVSNLFQALLHTIEPLNNGVSKINACMQLPGGPSLKEDKFEYFSTLMESVLSVRLSEETYRGPLRVIGAFEVSTRKDEIEKALEYLYDDVPKADC